MIIPQHHCAAEDAVPQFRREWWKGRKPAEARN
jgi:hypothetical protein